jgi:hypothetical protein
MTVRRDVHEDLRARLREAAAAREPDRARIRARVERGMAGAAPPAHRAARPRAAGWARVAGATAAVAGVLAVAGYAVASALGKDAPPQRTVAVSPTPTPVPTPTPTPSSGPSREATGRTPVPPAGPASGTAPEATGPSAPPERRPPSPGGVADGPLWSDGSVDPHSHEFWAQSNITLRTGERLTALTVRLEIRQTGGVSATGAWRSLPEDDFTLTIGERDGFLVYTWALKPGRTVPAGEWMFAGQYDHERGGRDATGDRYTATATTAAGARRLAVEGDFAARGAAARADGDGL